jgi:hypothetical protein
VEQTQHDNEHLFHRLSFVHNRPDTYPVRARGFPARKLNFEHNRCLVHVPKLNPYSVVMCSILMFALPRDTVFECNALLQQPHVRAHTNGVYLHMRSGSHKQYGSRGSTISISNVFSNMDWCSRYKAPHIPHATCLPPGACHPACSNHPLRISSSIQTEPSVCMHRKPCWITARRTCWAWSGFYTKFDGHMHSENLESFVL